MYRQAQTAHNGTCDRQEKLQVRAVQSQGDDRADAQCAAQCKADDDTQTVAPHTRPAQLQAMYFLVQDDRDEVVCTRAGIRAH